MSDVQVEEKFHVQLPDLTNDVEYAEFLDMLHSNVDKRGVKTLLGKVKQYHWHHVLLGKSWDKVCTTVNVINGLKSPARKRSYVARSAKHKSQAFFESLSTPALRQQCTVYGVSYDDYPSQEEIIELLVQRHLEEYVVV